MSKSMKILIGVLAVLFVGLAGYLVYDKFYKKVEPQVATSPTPAETTPVPMETTIKHVLDPGVTWLKEPEKLNDLGLVIKDSKDYSKVAEINYYKIADLDTGGELIMALVQYESLGGPELYRFKKDKEGKYYYLVKNSSLDINSEFEKIFSDKVSLDFTTIYQSISAPDYLKTDSVTLRKADYSPGQIFSQIQKPEEIIDTEYGYIYRVYAVNEPKEVGGIIYYLKLADTSLTQYSVKYDFMTDDEVALITWSDGEKNTKKYTPEGYTGCGSSAITNVVINTKNIDSRLKEAGKTNSGVKIYAPTSIEDVIIKTAYENYKTGREKDIISIEDFFKAKPVFLYKNAFGDYVIFTGRDFAGLAECGKPVIYLYPEKPTQVSVKVGADITKSEPLYNGSWSVMAEPSGKLKLDGRTYDYLFWEGLGLGTYPNIDSGFIVKKENLETTLKKHLSELGLNEKESADFMEFWLSKMPDSPYIRLTWFGTEEMNKLAPLFVHPKPDTMIRIFLDFAGLNQSINIKPQILSSIERKGFTLVEWGGLLKK